MPTYIALYKWTDEGVREVKDTVARSQQTSAVEKAGGRVIGVWWTQGACDLVAVGEFPHDETASAYALATGMAGNVRTETMRAFTAEEMQRIIDKLP